MELIDITRKLTGRINPIGETHTDNIRYENLNTTIELVEYLLIAINIVASNKDRPEYSMNRAGKCAAKFLSNVGSAYHD